MSHFIKTILITALLAVFIANGAFAARAYLPNNFHTPSTPLVLESLPVSGVRVAGVYWLPDYLDKNLDFTDRSQSVNCDKPEESDYNPNHPACKKVDERECKTLGYEIPSFVSDWSKYDYTEFLAANKIHCYKNFTCKSSYSKSSCDQWYQLAGSSCTDNRGTFYERCDPKPCPASYTAGITSCSPAAGYNYSSNGYSGTQICGKCTAKDCANGSTSSSCSNGYTVQANGSYSGSSACYSCVANACTGYGAKKEGSGWNCSDTCLSGSTTKYKCVAKACVEGSLTPNCDSTNYDTLNTSSYSGDSVCKKCSAKSCPNSKDCTYGCKTWDTSRQSMCGKICTECNSCTPKAAATGCSYGEETCDDNCGGTTTCCKGCSLPTCSGITTKPSNSYYVTSSCTDCSGTKTINTSWACNSGYNKSGESCIAISTPSCAEWLTAQGYTVITNSADFQSTLRREPEVVVMNDMNMGGGDIVITGYIFSPEYFHSEYSKCSGTPTISAGVVTVETGGDSFDIYPHIKLNNELDVNDDGNTGSATFYGNVSGGDIVGNDTATLTFYGNVDGSDLYGKTVVIASGGSIMSSSYGMDELILRDNGSSSEWSNGYKYTVISSGQTTIKNNGNYNLPYYCPSGNCKGNLSYRCEDKNGVAVDVGNCHDCGWRFPSTCSQNCSINSHGHCNDVDRIIKCSDSYAGISSDRYYSASKVGNGNCGNTGAPEYYEVTNCYDSCSRYGSGINYEAISYYGYANEAAFYKAEAFYKWCDDVSAGKYHTPQDLDNFCNCMNHCSDTDFSKCLNYTNSLCR